MKLLKKIFILSKKKTTITIEVIKKTIRELTDKEFPLHKSGMLTQLIKLYKYNS